MIMHTPRPCELLCCSQACTTNTCLEVLVILSSQTFNFVCQGLEAQAGRTLPVIVRC